MIQHDCGHGSFFRKPLANHWVGRSIGVLTLTPYDCWRRSHAVHHATSGNLDRRGTGDVTTLTVDRVPQPAALAAARLPTAAQPADPAGARPDLPVPAQAPPAGRADGQRQGGLDQRDGDQPRHRRGRGRHELSDRHPELPLGAAADHAAGLLDRDLAVLRPAPVRAHLLGPSGRLELPLGRHAGQHVSSICRRRYAGSPPTSASTTSITWRAGFRAIAWARSCATIRSCARSAG